MSALIGHAKAARILAKAFEDEWISGESAASPVARMMARTYRDAAERMEEAMRAEATGREDVP